MLPFSSHWSSLSTHQKHFPQHHLAFLLVKLHLQNWLSIGILIAVMSML